MEYQKGDTVERWLKPYNGFMILKVTDNKGLKTETTTYIAYDREDNLFNADKTLNGLKKKVDGYKSNIE